MPRRNTLNGIPHNLTKSFFSSERYYHKGYMGDWILNLARQLHLEKVSLNVLTAEFEQANFNIYPLAVHAKSLRPILEKELTGNGFATDFIVEAKIDMQFPDPLKYRTTIYCFPYIVDREGRKYESPRIIENGFEGDFDALDKRLHHPADPFNISLEHIPVNRIWRWNIWKRKLIIAFKNLLRL